MPHNEEKDHPLFHKLKQFHQFFLPEIERFFIELESPTKQIDPFAKEMLDKLREYTLRGGKKIRPALLYYNYQGSAENKIRDVLPIAIACELMQSFLLILDDVMDEAESRRGAASMHRLFFNEKGFSERTSESIALLAANTSSYLGIKAISDSEIEPKCKCAILSLYAQTCIDVGYGQALDVLPLTFNTLSEENIYKIYHYKTSCYTAEFPLLCAAALANSNEPTQILLKEIAHHIGLLFQMRDDILGLFSDSALIGKSVMSDVQQGKKTLLIFKTWEKANAQQKSIISKIYGRQEASEQDILMIKDMVHSTGALDDVLTKMQIHAKHIAKILENLNWSTEGKEFINDLVDFCIRDIIGY